jgi:hypothetical protein
VRVVEGAKLAERENTTRNADQKGAPAPTRRLSDKVLIAFHQACDQSDFEVAEQLLHILEMMVSRRSPPEGKRRNMASLVAAHERLWHLRHPDTGQEDSPLFATRFRPLDTGWISKGDEVAGADIAGRDREAEGGTSSP